MGNNPMVGASVDAAFAISQALILQLRYFNLNSLT